MPGPTLTTQGRSDVSVALTGSQGLLTALKLTVTITNHGPGVTQSAAVTTTLPTGLRTTSATCSMT